MSFNFRLQCALMNLYFLFLHHSIERECTNFLWHKFFLNNLILAIKSNIGEQRKIYLFFHWDVTIVLNKNFYVWINLNRLANCYNITRAIPLKCHHLIMQAVEDVCYILSPIIIAFQHCFPFCNIYWGNDIRSLQVMRQAIQTKTFTHSVSKVLHFPIYFPFFFRHGLNTTHCSLSCF